MSLTYQSKIYDPLHKFIRLTSVETKLVDSVPYQRLRHIHQLGISYLVYPGATHTRFEHSLGTMKLASDIYDRLVEYDFPLRGDVDLRYWRQIVRLAALCHDLGHLPFSHVAEKALLGVLGHERWTAKVIASSHLEHVWAELKREYPGQDVVTDVMKIAVGEEKFKEIPGNERARFTVWEKVLTKIITGDFFGADRIDYLLRDAQCTGLAYGLFDYHQLIEMLRLIPVIEDQGELLEIGIDENGIESCEALLLGRHFMYRRVYQYDSVKSYSFHLSRFMKALISTHYNLEDLDTYLFLTDNEVLCHLQRAVRDPQYVGYEDAQRLSTRHLRFKAIELKKDFSMQAYETLLKEMKIPASLCVFEGITKKKGKLGLSFPVIKGNGKVVSGIECSEIQMPSATKGWIYAAPEVVAKVNQFLENSGS